MNHKDVGQTIVLLDSDFADPSQLYEQLRVKYVEPNASYTLKFTLPHLTMVNKCFDLIIRDEGYREVDFEFSIDGLDRS